MYDNNFLKDTVMAYSKKIEKDLRNNKTILLTVRQTGYGNKRNRGHQEGGGEQRAASSAVQ